MIKNTFQCLPSSHSIWISNREFLQEPNWNHWSLFSLHPWQTNYRQNQTDLTSYKLYYFNKAIVFFYLKNNVIKQYFVTKMCITSLILIYIHLFIYFASSSCCDVTLGGKQWCLELRFCILCLVLCLLSSVFLDSGMKNDL